MIHRIARKLETGKKLLLGALGFAAIAAPITLGLLRPAASHAQEQSSSAAPLAIESATITPNKTGAIMPPFHIVTSPPNAGVGVLFKADRLLATNATLRFLIHDFYGVEEAQISGGPDWTDSDRYDVVVKFNRTTDDPLTDADRLQRKLMLQDMLGRRFKLQVHRELKQQQVYELVVGKNGSKLAEVHPQPGQTRGMSTGDPAVARAVRVEYLRMMLERRTGHLVIDSTGLKGVYNFTLDLSGTGKPPENNSAVLKAVSEQLGLELVPQTEAVETIVIDHAEPLVTEQK